jgi:hypothetical protein
MRGNVGNRLEPDQQHEGRERGLEELDQRRAALGIRTSGASRPAMSESAGQCQRRKP